MRYSLGLIGMWLFTDGLYSLMVYTRGEKSKGQSLLYDHSIRVIRGLIGLYLIIIGGMI